MSPASKAGMSKAPKIPSNNSSPALPPKPPRPSPARMGTALSNVSHGHEQGSNIKRKINWDAPNEHVHTSVDTSAADSGVKVNRNPTGPEIFPVLGELRLRPGNS